MKTYLSSEERTTNVFLGLLYLTTEAYMKRKDNYSAEEIKWLESTHFSLENYFVALKERVGEKEIERILREVDNSKPVVKPRGDKCEGQYLVDKNTLEEICRLAVESHCFGCERTDYEKCELCQFMDRAGMGSTDEQPGRCTYWYEPTEEAKK